MAMTTQEMINSLPEEAKKYFEFKHNNIKLWRESEANIDYNSSTASADIRVCQMHIRGCIDEIRGYATALRDMGIINDRERGTLIVYYNR